MGGGLALGITPLLREAMRRSRVWRASPGPTSPNGVLFHPNLNIEKERVINSARTHQLKNGIYRSVVSITKLLHALVTANKKGKLIGVFIRFITTTTTMTYLLTNTQAIAWGDIQFNVESGQTKGPYCNFYTYWVPKKPFQFSESNFIFRFTTRSLSVAASLQEPGFPTTVDISAGHWRRFRVCLTSRLYARRKPGSSLRGNRTIRLTEQSIRGDHRPNKIRAKASSVPGPTRVKRKNF